MDEPLPAAKRMPEINAYPAYLRRQQASAYLAEVWGLSYAVSTLAKMACLGTGPVAHRWGRITVHAREDLDEFAKSRVKPAPPRKVRAAQVELRAP
jgi:hypothetical protein